jgi:DNA-binding beta-propeller fold protein YncE
MRFSPIKILQGLLCSTPLLVLLLAACGGGGGGGSTPSAPLASAYTLSVNVTGLAAASGVVLRNNGVDDLAVSAPGVYPFATKVVSGTSYNVTVLTQPSSPVQLCTVTGPSGTMPASNLTLGVNCVNAYTIGGTITGAANGIGPILRNNGGDDLFIPAVQSGVAVSFTFSIPVESGASYTVTQLSQARSPGQDCSSITPVSGVASTSSAASGVSITCTLANTVPRFAYVTNSTAKTVSAYTIDAAASGVLSTAGAPVATGAEPYSVSVDPTGRFAYVANHSGNNISAYSIDTSTTSTAGALTAIDANGAVGGYQATIAAGTYPISVTVHPSGKFAYVANESSNSLSVYSINTTTGALSAIDADGATGTQASIATGTRPYAVTIDPTGYFAYVANYDSGNISAYSINQTSGALTSLGTVLAGTGPSSIAIDPTGKCALVANNASDSVESYIVNSDGTLATGVTVLSPNGSAPRSIAIDPFTGQYAYVANAGALSYPSPAGSVSALSINPTTCAIAEINADAIGASPTIAADVAPISINVDPSGAFVYVANFGAISPQGYITNGSVSVYSINGAGALTFVENAPTVTGTTISSVTTTQ